jgi:hypothetical protein
MSDLHGGAVARNIELDCNRLRYLVGKIHRLGPRPIYELFRELASGGDLQDVLERFARLAPLGEFISHLGGDQLPPPARLVGGLR